MSYNPNFSGKSSVLTVASNEVNNTGSTIPKMTPVRIDASGDMALISVSVEAEALAIAGLTDNNVLNGVAGSIINSGRILNVTTLAILGEILYLSSTGGTTNIKPTIGVDGFLANDFVIRVGIVAKNTSNPLNKDLIINISVVGQL